MNSFKKLRYMLCHVGIDLVESKFINVFVLECSFEHVSEEKQAGSISCDIHAVFPSSLSAITFKETDQ